MRSFACLLLITTLVACGDDDAFPDAAVHDASQIDGGVIDATPDAAAPTVTIHVEAFGGPTAGIVVLFHGPDGALITRVTTGKDGNATAEVPAGSSATAVIQSKGTELHTVLGLQPGDVVPLGHYFDSGGADLGSQIFNVPNIEFPRYQVCLPCSCTAIDGPTGAQVFIVEGCATATQGDVLATTLDEGGQPDQYFVQNAVTLGTGDPVTLTGTFGPTPRPLIDLGLLDDTISQIQLNASALHGDNAWASAGTVGSPVFNENTQFVLYVPDVPDGVSFHVRLEDFVGGNRTSTLRVAALPESQVYALADDFLPQVDTLDPYREGMGWTVRGASTADGVIAGIGTGGTYWTVIAPGDATSITLPALPDDLTGLWPSGDVSYYGEVDLYESDAVTSYDQFRVQGDRAAALLYLPSNTPPPHGVNRVRTSTGVVPVPQPSLAPLVLR